MNILDEIVAYKYKEVEERKGLFPVKLLENSIHFDVDTVSMKHYIQRDDKSGIIAEIKRKSPSKGIINKNVSVERISIGYMQAGASGLSILTDKKYFGGDSEDLLIAREYNYCPILRKDFIVDEYQIIEAKSIGADVVLLIAAALAPNRLAELAKFAKTLGLEVLLEVHNLDELEATTLNDIDLIGVNNRNLKSFEVDINISKQLSTHIPNDFVKVTESGISSPESVIELKKFGYEGFLIGENFMRNNRPEEACAAFVQVIENADRKG
ncbi:MAG: indole-3-glycerol phosphate synthase TrpC [Cyclobacteriaceae bacterium]|nr:indole-3-glycerol phosphate synthase TrpC [Cyclobacteriaceae bacterium]